MRFDSSAFRQKMIYTLGKIEIYEKYLNDDPSPRKAVGGAAWETLDAVRAYLLDWYMTDPSEAGQFAVYGMNAEWGVDTVPDPEMPDQHYGVLNKEARLYRVLFREGGTLMRG